MSLTKETIIGSVKLDYRDDGLLIRAEFTPNISVTKEELTDQLGDCKNKTIDDVKEAAQLLLASFFNKVSNIELRDMERTEIETHVVNTDNYPQTATIKTAEIEFIYKQKID